MKYYRAHLGPVDALVVSADGSLCASVCRDQTVKVFDVMSFDMIAMMKVGRGGGSGCSVSLVQACSSAQSQCTVTGWSQRAVLLHCLPLQRGLYQSCLHQPRQPHESSGSAQAVLPAVACLVAAAGNKAELPLQQGALPLSGYAVYRCQALTLAAVAPCTQVSFVPGCAEWCYDRQEAQAKLALSDLNSGAIHVYDMKSGSSEAVQVLQVHKAPVTAMRYAAAHRVVVSSDARGFLEYWSSSSYGHPEELVTYK